MSFTNCNFSSSFIDISSVSSSRVYQADSNKLSRRKKNQINPSSKWTEVQACPKQKDFKSRHAILSQLRCDGNLLDQTRRIVWGIKSHKVSLNWSLSQRLSANLSDGLRGWSKCLRSSHGLPLNSITSSQNQRVHELTHRILCRAENASCCALTTDY